MSQETTPLSEQIDQIIHQARQGFNRKHQRLLRAVQKLKRQLHGRKKAKAARIARRGRK